MKKLIFILLAVSVSHATLAHQDFFISQTFGKVHTRIKTGYDYAQIGIVSIIGKAAEKLLKQLDYSGPVLLDFNHAYIADIDPDYFISYDKGAIKYTWHGGDGLKAVLKKNGIVIRQVAHTFDVENTLKLLEFSIQNINKIRRNQQPITYEENYCQWKIYSIDPQNIGPIISQSASQTLEKILNQRTYRDTKIRDLGVSCFYQNRQFHFLVKAHKGADGIIALSTDRLFQVSDIDLERKLIFDSDSTFYCVGGYNGRIVSKQHVISNVKDNFQTFKIKDMGRDLISITMNRFTTPAEREMDNHNFYFTQTSIYDLEQDKLTNDVKAELRK